MTIGEIETHLNVYQQDLEVDKQNKLFISYQTAVLTANFVLNGMNGKQPPSFYEMYPEYYTEEVKEQEQKAKTQEYLAQWKAFAAYNNSRREVG